MDNEGQVAIAHEKARSRLLEQALDRLLKRMVPHQAMKPDADFFEDQDFASAILLFHRQYPTGGING